MNISESIMVAQRVQLMIQSKITLVVYSHWVSKITLVAAPL
jgi:hypothetical protein